MTQVRRELGDVKAQASTPGLAQTSTTRSSTMRFDPRAGRRNRTRDRRPDARRLDGHRPRSNPVVRSSRGPHDPGHAARGARAIGRARRAAPDDRVPGGWPDPPLHGRSNHPAPRWSGRPTRNANWPEPSASPTSIHSTTSPLRSSSTRSATTTTSPSGSAVDARAWRKRSPPRWRPPSARPTPPEEPVCRRPSWLQFDPQPARRLGQHLRPNRERRCPARRMRHDAHREPTRRAWVDDPGLPHQVASGPLRPPAAFERDRHREAAETQSPSFHSARCAA